MNFIQLDGSRGEGGGQILRSALTLSMITGKAFRIESIRAGRSKPGLLRQHLTAVAAATEICGAEVSGAEVGSQTLMFAPGKIRAGEYRFAIGTAGSCTLVLQTVLPALGFASAESSLSVSGGTHNPAAPPADFIIRTWLPLARIMGADMAIELLRHGFYPAGGGEVRAFVKPVKPVQQPLQLESRGELLSMKAIAIIAGVPRDVARRELDRLTAQLGVMDQEVRALSSREGPGNALLVELHYPEFTETFTEFGERGTSAEAVADRLGRRVREFLKGGWAVGEHLADQLLLPMSLSGGGSFTTGRISGHLASNAEVIEQFLPVKIHFAPNDAEVRVSVLPD